jgi:hypothetical protein
MNLAHAPIVCPGISKTRLKAAIAAGQLRSHRVGRVRVIVIDDLIAWIRTHG